MRLLSPVAHQVAERYPPPSLSAVGTRAELMSRAFASEMFSEKMDDRRVRVGMHEDKETGETIFGTYLDFAD